MDFDARFIRSFNKSDVLFEQGSSGNQMYIVLSGKVSIIQRSAEGELKVLTQLGAGEMFGEMALVDSGVRSADAIVDEDNTRVVMIDQARFVYLVSQQPAFALSVMRVLCQRIQSLGMQPACSN